MPLVCVIVPVYNAEEYLAPCIESILAQTYKEFALVLVDDGSTDGSPQVCSEYATRDRRVVAISQENKGAAAARNRGIEWALAQDSVGYLAFVDSDDWIHPEYLSKLHDGIVSTGCKLSMCCAETVETREHCLRDEAEAIEVQTPEYLWCKDRGLCVVPWGKLYATSLFEAIRFPEYARAAEDEFVSYQVLFGCGDICLVDQRLYAYYQSTDSIMRSGWTEKRMAGLRALEQQLEFFSKNGYREALHESANTYLYLIHDYICQIAKSDDASAYTTEQKILRKKLSAGVDSYFRRYSFPVRGNEWVLALKYPLIGKTAIRMRRILDAVARHKGNLQSAGERC